MYKNHLNFKFRASFFVLGLFLMIGGCQSRGLNRLLGTDDNKPPQKESVSTEVACCDPIALRLQSLCAEVIKDWKNGSPLIQDGKSLLPRTDSCNFGILPEIR